MMRFGWVQGEEEWLFQGGLNKIFMRKRSLERWVAMEGKMCKEEVRK